MIGRESGKVFPRQTFRSAAKAIEPVVLRVTSVGTAGAHRREWSRDGDGDGVREVHSNRIEGLWLGLRNHLRPFRGVSTWCLDLSLAFYQGMHNIRRDVLGFFRQLLRPITPEGT